jgi:hypothetical protein
LARFPALQALQAGLSHHGLSALLRHQHQLAKIGGSCLLTLFVVQILMRGRFSASLSGRWPKEAHNLLKRSDTDLNMVQFPEAGAEIPKNKGMRNHQRN